jgi:hypothetical protein
MTLQLVRWTRTPRDLRSREFVIITTFLDSAEAEVDSRSFRMI